MYCKKYLAPYDSNPIREYFVRKSVFCLLHMVEFSALVGVYIETTAAAVPLHLPAALDDGQMNLKHAASN